MTCRHDDRERAWGHPGAGAFFAGLDGDGDGRDLDGVAAPRGPWRQSDDGGVAEDVLVACMDHVRGRRGRRLTAGPTTGAVVLTCDRWRQER